MRERIVLEQGKKGFELPISGSNNWIMLRDGGYSPVQSLVAAIGSCGGYVYQELLNNSNVPFTFHRVDIDYTRHENSVGELASVTLIFVVSIEEAYQAKAQAIVRLVSRYCPVIQSLNTSIQINENVQFI